MPQLHVPQMENNYLRGPAGGGEATISRRRFLFPYNLMSFSFFFSGHFTNSFLFRKNCGAVRNPRQLD